MSTEICTLEQKIKRLEFRQEELRFALGTAWDAIREIDDLINKIFDEDSEE
jgi:division protein CdvB (Snf7/Vps24/ESCRT-III family)